MNQNNKKALAEQLKKELNSLEYIAMPDLITSGDYHGHILGLDLKDRDGWIWNMRKGSWKKVKESQLEPNDWEEIINLIEKRNEEKQQIWETKRKNIEQKLNQQSNLYYYWGKGDLQKKRNGRADGWHENKSMRGFSTFLGGNGNGLTHHLYIAEEHSVLDNFSFQTGFYLIDNDKTVEKMVGHYEGGFGCSGGETNPNNWKKYVEASDQITITPVEITNKPLEKPSQNKTRENNQIAGGKNNNLNDSTKKLPDESDQKIINWLIQYFQKNNIKEISLEGNNLVITDNSGENVKGAGKVNNNSQLKNIQNYLVKTGENSLKLESLKELINNSSQNSTSNSSKTDYIPWIISGFLLVCLVGAMVIILKPQRKKHKTN